MLAPALFALSILLTSSIALANDLPKTYYCYNQDGDGPEGRVDIRLKGGFYYFSEGFYKLDVEDEVLRALGARERDIRVYRNKKFTIKVPAKDCQANTFASGNPEKLSCNTERGELVVTAEFPEENQPDQFEASQIKMRFSTQRGIHGGRPTVNVEQHVTFMSAISGLKNFDLSFLATLELPSPIDSPMFERGSGCEVTNQYDMRLEIKKVPATPLQN